MSFQLVLIVLLSMMDPNVLVVNYHSSGIRMIRYVRHVRMMVIMILLAKSVRIVRMDTNLIRLTMNV